MSLEIRLIRSSDYTSGFLTLLSQLNGFDYTQTCTSQAVFDEMISNQLIYVGTIHNKLVCTGKLLLEKKFGASVVHIEDVVVDKAYRGFGYGKRLLASLCDFASKYSPYKIILTCTPNLISFYESCKFTQYGVSMKLKTF
jgi:glucosamine-phosphate N-acetyltransferase